MLTLQELNEKYPTCSTCAHQATRPARKNQPYRCGKHHRAIQYVMHEGEVVCDIPCGDYAYEKR